MRVGRRRRGCCRRTLGLSSRPRQSQSILHICREQIRSANMNTGNGGGGGSAGGVPIPQPLPLIEGGGGTLTTTTHYEWCARDLPRHPPPFSIAPRWSGRQFINDIGSMDVPRFDTSFTTSIVCTHNEGNCVSGFLTAIGKQLLMGKTIPRLLGSKETRHFFSSFLLS